MQLTNTLLLLSGAASTVMGITHVVKVSVGSALAYEPNSIAAAVGDKVEFDFLNGVSSVPLFFFLPIFLEKEGGEAVGTKPT
jgi:hypothetical protein